MYEGKNMGGCEVKRETAASEIVKFAAAMAERADTLAGRLNGKLQPVMTSPCPRPDGPCGTTSREYPPLFGELRHHLEQIRSALSVIDDAIDRTEL